MTIYKQSKHFSHLFLACPCHPEQQPGPASSSSNLSSSASVGPLVPLPEDAIAGKEFFITCNVLLFSCTHLALWKGKRPKVCTCKTKRIQEFL